MLFKKSLIPAGLTTLSLPYSDSLQKTVRVYVPEHKKGQKLPVIYMTDGQSVFDEESNPLGCWHTREAVAAEQAASGKAAIIVGIHSEPHPMHRTAELTPASIGAFTPPPMDRECRPCRRECRPCREECRPCRRECRPCRRECRPCRRI